MRGWHNRIASSALGGATHLLRTPHGCVIIDTGHPRYARETVRALRDVTAFRTAPLTQVLHTHLHADHTGASALLARCQPGAAFLAAPDATGCAFRREERALGIVPRPFTITKRLYHNDVLALGDDELRCLETPGHCDGHLCYFLQRRRVLFCGDIIANADIGTLDITRPWRESVERMRGSIEMLHGLNPLCICPAHGSSMAPTPLLWKRLQRRLAPDHLTARVLVSHTLMPLLLLALEARGPQSLEALKRFTREHRGFLSVFIDDIDESILDDELPTMLLLLQVQGVIVRSDDSYRLSSFFLRSNARHGATRR